ncbi:MAG: RidA family protein [Pseudomonadota bacterium]
MSRQLISSGSPFEREIAYSRAVIDGDYVFVSGTTGYDYQAMAIADRVEDQAEQCFRNIAGALKQAGCSMNKVVRVRYIVPKREYFEPCWPVIRKYLGEVKPAATMFIADLMDPAMKLEIEVTARLSNA